MQNGANPKDPLLKSGPDQQRELFDKIAQLASGFSTEDVLGATMNVLVNALRQAHSSQSMALTRYDEVTAKVKSLLASHYDAIGKRRNVFPFHQTIVMPHFNDSDKT